MTKNHSPEQLNIILLLHSKRQFIDPVLEAMIEISPGDFLEESLCLQFYEDKSVTIAEDRFLPCLSDLALALNGIFDANCPPEKILEIGTGLGYQTALLANLAREVFSVEEDEQLFRETSARMKHLKKRNIFLKNNSPIEGWQDNAPYDAAFINTALEEFPPAILGQLSANSRIVAPIKTRGHLEWVLGIKRKNRVFKETLGKVVRDI